ncbi:MAG: arginase family protein [Candidatus Nanoarchaeia archaeon]|nr:arginase family protein [Candidatus Nanoarchaeia archaeon]
MKIIKIPFSAGGLGKTNGTEIAPSEIVEELRKISINQQGVKLEFNVESVNVNNSNISETNENIYNYLMQNDEMPIILGGDHSITYACFKAFSRQFENPGIIVFDAHPDCESNFNPPTHEDYLRVLIEEGHLKKSNVIVVGLRRWDAKEYEYLKKNKIKFFSMKEIISEGITEVSEALMSAALNFGSLYISLDIDVLDPAFAPGTGYLEPFGMNTQDLMFLLNRLSNLRNLNALDLVEINPKKDISNITVKTGALINSELFKTNNF